MHRKPSSPAVLTGANAVLNFQRGTQKLLPTTTTSTPRRRTSSTSILYWLVSLYVCHYNRPPEVSEQDSDPAHPPILRLCQGEARALRFPSIQTRWVQLGREPSFSTQTVLGYLLRDIDLSCRASHYGSQDKSSSSPLSSPSIFP